MKHISFQDMSRLFRSWNDAGMSKSLIGFIVYSEFNWPDKNFSLESRTYRVTSDAKIFHSDMCGSSLFGYNLDGSDQGVRLDRYNWEIEYCYVKDPWNENS